MADTPELPEVQGKVPMYKKPVALNKEAHRKYGMTPSKRPYGFLAETHFVPAIVGEFAQMSAHYPIIFQGDRRVPLIVMGLRQNENVFVDENGQLDREAVPPAFVRRYPFVSARNADDQPVTVCFDIEADGVTQEPEIPFFNESGEPTAELQTAIDFVGAFESDARSTDRFVQRLVELDLFERKDVNITQGVNDRNPGQTQKIADYWGISEQKLNALPDETFLELKNGGFLVPIYAHLISLQRWERIIGRTMMRQQAKANQKAN